MIETVTSILSAIKATSPKVCLGISIGTGAILFAGENFARVLGLAEFRNQYRGYIGAIFVVSLSIVLANAIWGSGKYIKSYYDKYLKQKAAKKSEDDRRKMVQDLTPDEKAYLVPYILRKENTQYFQIEDGIAGGLEAKGIIYKASSVGSLMTGWAYNIQPWAREYLTEHPELLKGASKEPKKPRNW